MLVALMFVGMLPTAVFAESSHSVQMEFYVSTQGNDENAGTESAPFLTIERAAEEVRKYNENMTGDIIVNIAPGRYELNDRIRLRAEDSGSNGYDVIYRGARHNLPVISGGRIVSGWQKGENGIWHAKAEHLKFVRDLYIDDAMGIRAQTQNKISGIRNYKNADGVWTGFYVRKSQLGFLENPEDVQLHWTVTWKSQRGNVQDIIPDPEDPENVIIIMEEGFWEKNVTSSGASSHGDLDFGYAIEFEVENAYELLDEPGEFYFNKKTKILSYMPREGEDLTTAQVICPQEDQVLLVAGLDYDNRIHNIRFEDICFAHTSFSAMEHGYVGGQGEVMYSMGGGSEGRAIKGGVEVKWADEVDFYSCRFFGETSTALCLPEGVHNCEIIGNVFTDLGSSAITVGNAMQMDFVEPEPIDGPTNIMWRKGYTASNMYGEPLGISWRAISNYGSYVDTSDSATAQQSLTPGRGWRSTENVLKKGIYPWIKIDLDSEYSIDSIRLSFENGQLTGKVSDVERSNFEVLVSNDEDFEEYEVLGTITNPADTITTIEGTDNKYRFVMLRKTKLEPFALTGIWIYSYDVGPSGQRGAPTNITIANNYIQRPAMINTQGLGILAYYTKNMVIEHNEIYDAPYSGISFGWNWDEPQTTGGDNKVNYNRIHNVMRYTNDGGGIYHLGNGPGDEVIGNYISRLDGNQGFAMYMDAGSTQTTFKDNVVLESSTTAFFATYSYNCTVDGVWSDVGEFYNIRNSLREEETNEVKNDHIIDITNPPEEAARIMANAGLAEEFEYIRERVPQNEYPLMKGPYTHSPCLRVYNGRAVERVQYFIAMAEHIANSGRFGDLPWLYAPEFKYTLQYHIDRLRGESDSTDDISGGRIEEQAALRDEIEKAYDSVVHPEWEDMLTLCDEKLGEAKVGNVIGTYPEDAVKEFGAKVEEVKATNPQTKADKFVAVLALEKAYETLESKKYAADITYVHMEDGKTQIDKANKRVLVTMPLGLDLSQVTPIIETSGGSEITTDLTGVGYGDVSLPVKNNALGQYDFWTLSVISESEKYEQEKNDSWFTNNPNTKIPICDDVATIQPWFDANMYAKPMGNEISFDLWAERPDADDGLGIIFASHTTNLERKGLFEKNTYYELNIKGQIAELYKVSAGVRSNCATISNLDFEYNEFNHFDIKVSSENTTDSVTVELNGSEVLDVTVQNGIGDKGYFGVFNKHQKLKIKALVSAVTVQTNAAIQVYSINGGHLTTADGEFAKDKNYVFLAADYDSKGNLLGSHMEDAKYASQKLWAAFEFNADKTTYFDDVEDRKFFLWEKESLMPVVEEQTNHTATTSDVLDIAAFSAVFASSALEENLPEAAVDGDENTYWQAYTEGASTATNESCYRQRFVVDLGAAYPVQSVEYLPSNEDAAKMFDIYVSNNPQFVPEDVVYINQKSSSPVSTSQPTTYKVNDGGSYRYVVVEKIFAYGSLGIKELKVNVPAVICDDTEIMQNYLTEDAYGYRTHNGKTAETFSYSNLGGKNITQTSYDDISLVVPLGEPSCVTHIAMESGDQGTGANQYDFRTDFKIVGLEPGECEISGGQPVFELEDCDILAVQDGIAGLPKQGYSGLILYHVPEQFQNKVYEYIGFYKDSKYNNGTPDDTSDDKLQLRMNNIYIFNCEKVKKSEFLTDAASDSMVYSITNSTGHSGACAVDNDPATYYESGSSTDAKRNNLVVDLGAAYPIASIDYLPMSDDTAAANFSIYVSNDPQFQNKTLVHSQGLAVADKDNMTNYKVLDSTPYRYVLVEKNPGTGKLGIAEINVNVPTDLYADKAGVSRANLEIKNRGAKVWRSATDTLVKAQVGQVNGENTLQTYEHYWNGLTADSTKNIYMYYDLGANGARVDTIAFADCALGTDVPNLSRRSNFRVILSNNADLSKGVTIYTQEGIAGGNDASADSGLVLYHVPEEYKNTKYRYVGIYKDTVEYFNSAWRLKLAYGIMDIYTIQ